MLDILFTHYLGILTHNWSLFTIGNIIMYIVLFNNIFNISNIKQY